MKPQRDLHSDDIKCPYLNFSISRQTLEYLIIWTSFTIFLVLFLDKMGTLFSGYHLQDDQDYIKIQRHISAYGIWGGILQFMKNDLSIRFRPLWSFFRSLDSILFIEHFGIIALKNAVIISTASSLNYVFARKMGVSRFFSLFFCALIILGRQSAVIWRLGPQEGVGTLFFSLSLLLTYNLANNRSLLNKVFFYFSLLLLSLQKECFLVCVPAFFLLLFIFTFKDTLSKNNFIENVKLFFHYFLGNIICTIITLLIESFIILKYVGTNSIGYAGFSASDHISVYLEGIYTSLRRTCFPYLILIILFFLFFQLICSKKVLNLSFFLELIFCAYIMSTQLVTYAKIGIYERYLLPFVFGVGYLTIIMGYRYFKNQYRVKFCYTQALIVFILYISWHIPNDAKAFTLQSENFQEIVSDITSNYSTDSKIILCSSQEYGEFDISCKAYLEHFYGYSDITFIEEYSNDYSQIGEADILWGVAGEAQTAIVHKAKLDKSQYRIHQTTNFEIAVK
ncbi:MAG: hypothetical protein IKL51_02975 [Lachnospiraceae bacterium]|nr:hypothetical protein [Lachnospiraceae bacterium]